MLPGGQYQLATKWEVLFANTFTQIDSELFSSSVIGICEMSLWTRNMTPPPWIFLTFLYALYGQVSGKGDGPDIKLFILVGLGRSFFVCCLAHRGSTVGFLLLQCSSGVVRHPRDLQVSVATHFCRVLIFASSLFICDLFVSRDDPLMS